jgi:hypothetical protein
MTKSAEHQRVVTEQCRAMQNEMQSGPVVVDSASESGALWQAHWKIVVIKMRVASS